MKIHSEYPKELYVPIEGSSYHLGRLTVNWSHDGITVDIDIVLKESRKIWSSVKRIYKQEDEQEAIDNSMQILSEYLRDQSVK
jgi:hypothetical protein